MKYCLHANPLTKNGDFMAVPQDIENYGIEEVITQITGPGSILKKTECRAVIYAFLDKVAENAEKGIGLLSPYLVLTPGLSGVFEDEQDKFDESRHSREVHINPGSILRKSIEKMEVEKVPVQKRRPVITQVFDIKSGEENHVITPGHMIEIMGSNLKVGNNEDKNQGIFLVDTANGKAIKAIHIHYNVPGKLSVVLPETLAKGTYQLIVKTIYNNCKTLKQGTLESPLEVK